MEQVKKLRNGDKLIIKSAGYKVSQAFVIGFFVDSMTKGTPEIGGAILIRISLIDPRSSGFNYGVHVTITNAAVCAPYNQRLYDMILRRNELTQLIDRAFSTVDAPKSPAPKKVADLTLKFDVQPRYDLFLKKPREEARSATDKDEDRDSRQDAEQYKLAKGGSIPLTATVSRAVNASGGLTGDAARGAEIERVIAAQRAAEEQRVARSLAEPSLRLRDGGFTQEQLEAEIERFSRAFAAAKAGNPPGPRPSGDGVPD